ncbi:Uncharacterized protein FKW44_016374 [Caligus rogercresseyi]|uniref:Uncharacterized protein n=1 Tax=Caligus rogercresseyi TaxID=217165 RepID=A0A7T8H1M9_CALRO|nr:Uncharacterized protein FKW44_016374 [Caligus rogercresseyi]
MVSRTLERAGRMQIGLYDAGSAVGLPLKTGSTFDILSAVGTVPEASHRFTR